MGGDSSFVARTSRVENSAWLLRGHRRGGSCGCGHGHDSGGDCEHGDKGPHHCSHCGWTNHIFDKRWDKFENLSGLRLILRIQLLPPHVVAFTMQIL